MAPRPDVSAERRAQIIRAAMACFLRKGYNNTTMDDIVAESGLSKGSLYWYFQSKDDLFITALTSFLTEITQAALAPPGPGLAPSETLRRMAQGTARMVRETQGLFSLFLEFWSSSPRREEAGQLWADMLTQYKDLIVETIEAGVRSGEFRPVDAERLVWAMMAAYDGLAAYLMLMPELDVEGISQVFVEALLEGLRARG